MRKKWIALLAVGLMVAIYIGCYGNSPPQIISITIDPSPVGAYDTVRIICEAEDADNDSLEYRWVYPTEFFCLICREDLPTLMLRAPEDSGTYNLSVEVRDGRGGKTIRDIVVRVRKNHSPEILSITITPRPVRVSDTVKITCEAEDRDNDPLGYEWKFPADFSYICGVCSPWLSLIAPPDTGTYEFVIEVRDSLGGGVVDTFDIVVRPRRVFN